ncbi:capsular exopolysaccharide family [bacterium A37T11]|nr:capsular exopolysaccharide family [bacterium A37T11]
MNSEKEVHDLEFNLNSPFNLKEYIFRLIRLWPLAVGGILFCFAFGFLYLKSAIPEYHVNAKLLIEDEKKTGESNISDMLDLGGLLGAKSSVDNEAEVLQTRILMDELVRDLKLNVIWFEKGPLRDKELYLSPFNLIVEHLKDSIITTDFDVTLLGNSKFRLDYEDPHTKNDLSKEGIFGQPFELEGFGLFRLNNEHSAKMNSEKNYMFTLSSIDAKVAELQGNLVVTVTNKLASTVDIVFDYPVSAKGEKILRTYIDEYIRQNFRDKSRIADSTIEFIDKRITLVNQDLDLIEGKIQGFMQGSGLANISEQSKLLFSNSSEYIKQLADIQTKIQTIVSVENQLKDPKNYNKIIAGSVLADDPGFTGMINRYNEINLQRERALLSYTEENPFIQNMDQQINSVRQDIQAFIKSTKINLEISQEETKKNINLLEGNIRQVPAQERSFLDFSRQQQIKQDLYVFLLQKREETAVAKTSNMAGIRIIDPPKAEYVPFSPRKSLVFAAALLIGLLIPSGWIYLQDLLDTTVQSRKDVEKRTQVPIVGEISHNQGEEEVPFNASRSAIAEQFRGLRTNLQFLLGSEKNKVILVSSGQPGEGKSFISLNLARVYAVSGKKVLLLEFDLRKPKLSATFNTYGHTGITNYLVNPDMNYRDILVVSDVVTGQLSFAPSGPIPPNPSELILNGRLLQFFEQVRKDFDYIIVDAPPVGAVTDAQLLSEYSDVCLYLVRCGVTPHEVLNIPEDLRINKKIKNVGIVLNDISDHAPGYYGYGYYHSEDEKKGWLKKLFAKVVSKK